MKLLFNLDLATLEHYTTGPCKTLHIQASRLFYFTEVWITRKIDGPRRFFEHPTIGPLHEHVAIGIIEL